MMYSPHASSSHRSDARAIGGVVLGATLDHHNGLVASVPEARWVENFACCKAFLTPSLSITRKNVERKKMCENNKAPCRTRIDV